MPQLGSEQTAGAIVGLLDLPSEVRLQIYHHLFMDCPGLISIRVFVSTTSSTPKQQQVNNQSSSHGNSTLSRAIRRFNPSWLRSRTSPASVSHHVRGQKSRLSQSRLNSTFRLFGPHRSRPWILLTCRTIYREAWDIFLSNIEVHYGIPATIPENDFAPTTRNRLSLNYTDSASISTSDYSSVFEAQFEDNTEIWTKHVTHGSNIVLFTSDCAKIEKVYDNIQISYTPGFKSELLCIVPNVRTLTVRRNWDKQSGKFSGKEQDINLYIEYENTIVDRDKDLALLGITDDNDHNDDDSSCTHDSSSINLEEIRKAVVKLIKAIRLEDSEDRLKRPFWTESTDQDLNEKWERLLTQSRKERGFTVHMDVAIKLLIKNMKLSPHLMSNPNMTSNSNTIDPIFKPYWMEKWSWSPTPNSISGFESVKEQNLYRTPLSSTLASSLTTNSTTTDIDTSKKPEARSVEESESTVAANTSQDSSAPAGRWITLTSRFDKLSCPECEDHEHQRQAHLEGEAMLASSSSPPPPPPPSQQQAETLIDVGTVLVAKIDVKYDWDSGEIVNMACNPIRLQFMTQF